MTVLDNKTKLNYQNGYLIYNKKYIFKGKFLSKDQFKIAEICFNTSMTGYQEILTDPSYKSQFINFTFPLIGIVGCNNEDYESWKIHASGLICNELFELSSNWRAQTNFTNWIISQNSCAFFDLDTRAVTKIVRNFGPKNIMLCSEEYFENKGIEQICKQIDQSLSLEENDVIKDFTSELNIEKQEIGKKKYSIAFLNFGAKDNIKKNLYSRNCKIEEFDMNFKAEDIINKNFDGFFLSNGPGDPKKVYEIIKPELNRLLNKKTKDILKKSVRIISARYNDNNLIEIDFNELFDSINNSVNILSFDINHPPYDEGSEYMSIVRTVKKTFILES